MLASTGVRCTQAATVLGRQRQLRNTLPTVNHPPAAQALRHVTVAAKRQGRQQAQAAASVPAPRRPAVCAAAKKAAPPSSAPTAEGAAEAGSEQHNSTHPHLRGLSAEQHAPVEAPLGPVRVVAGPGSGKTKVFVARIAQLIQQHGVRAPNILAVTFTNKAADEMRERLVPVLGENTASAVRAGTFHSFCHGLLTRYISRLPGVGRTERFTVYDQDACISLLLKLVKAEYPGIPSKNALSTARDLASRISRIKSSMEAWHGATPQEVKELFKSAAIARLGTSPTANQIEAAEDLADWFESYEAGMRANNACDFDDLLGLSVALLRHDHNLRQRVLHRFSHVLVDEMQDTNTAQYELIKLLTLPQANLFVVGDPDQSIYGWRGADMGNMTQALARDFPHMQTYSLKDNYRSTARIVATAEKLISHNKDWERAGLTPVRQGGQHVMVFEAYDREEEAEHIAEETARLLASGNFPAEEVAVLCRVHHQTKLVEEELVKRSIPFVVVGGVSFWKRAEIQDVMAYLRLAVGLQDTPALLRIINTPRRNIGDKSVEKLQMYADDHGLTLASVLFGSADSLDLETGGILLQLPALPEDLDLGPKALEAVEGFRQLIAGFHHTAASCTLSETLEAIIRETGYEDYLVGSGTGKRGKGKKGAAESIGRLDILFESAKDYWPGKLAGAAPLDLSDPVEPKRNPFDRVNDSISLLGPLELARSFVNEMALYSDTDTAKKGVRLMTMHAAKGLEFEAVFIPGCVDELMPGSRDDPWSREDPVYSERRVFFVAVTRAKSHLYLTSSTYFSLYGKQSKYESYPSRFLKEVESAGHTSRIQPQARTTPQ